MNARQGVEEQLRERARRLARVAVRDEVDGQEHLLVGVGATRMVVPVSALRQVVAPGPVTPLPGLPAELRGVRALRGEAVCLADTGALSGAESTASEPDRQHVVVLEGECPLGLLVDEVLELLRLTGSDLLRLSPDHERTSRFLSGVTQAGVLVLDPQALLADPRLHVSASTDQSEGRQ